MPDPKSQIKDLDHIRTESDQRGLRVECLRLAYCSQSSIVALGSIQALHGAPKRHCLLNAGANDRAALDVDPMATDTSLTFSVNVNRLTASVFSAIVYTGVYAIGTASSSHIACLKLKC